MNNEWQDLDQYNLPDDILKPGAWEIEAKNPMTGKWTTDFWPARESLPQKLRLAFHGDIKYRIRRYQPKAPTHEEIVNKWWKNDKGLWFRISAYDKDGYYWATSKAVYRRYDFESLESADIPPEAS